MYVPKEKIMQLKHYETIFILSPVLSSDQVKASIHRYKAFLEDNKATIEYEEEMGLKPLAYPIAHKKSGFYYLIEFSSAPCLIKELEILYARDEAVLRFLTFVLDKYALAYNLTRRGSKNIDEPSQKVSKTI